MIQEFGVEIEKHFSFQEDQSWQNQEDIFPAFDVIEDEIESRDPWDELGIDADEAQEIRERFNIPMSGKKTTGEFRGIGESRWEDMATRIQDGDENLRDKVLDACLHKILDLAMNFTEQNGLTTEDYFMAGYCGYLEGMSKGYPRAESMTYLTHLNVHARSRIANMIAQSSLLEGSINGLSATNSAEKFKDPTPREKSDISELVLAYDGADPCAQVMDKLHDEGVHRMLNTLSPRDRKVIEMRYGIGREKSATAGEVAEEIGVTRSFVYQIENSCLSKMARATESEIFLDQHQIEPSLELGIDKRLPNDGLGYYRHQDRSFDGVEFARQKTILKTRAINMGSGFRVQSYTPKMRGLYIESLRNIARDLLKEGPKTPNEIIQHIEKSTGVKNIVEYKDIRLALLKLSGKTDLAYQDRAVKIMDMLGGDNFRNAIRYLNDDR